MASSRLFARASLALFICCGVVETVDAFSSSSLSYKPQSVLQSRNVLSFPAGMLSMQRNRSPLCASTHDGVNEVREDSSDILPASVAVGVITAAMGYLYGQVLSRTVSTLWKSFPALFARRGITLNPIYFITGTCTMGGLIMGIMSSKLKASFSVADFVSAFSSVPAESGKLPQSRSSLLPLLLLSLVTSTFGFSVGPEAPMVCAGGLVGASLARKWFGSDDIKTAETLAYAGAAGALTSFMGIPIAGSIFALELTRSSAGLSSGAKDALSPAVAASVAGLVLLRAFLIPDTAVGGHFTYGAVGSLSGRTMMLAALASSVIGAGLGTVFHKVVAFLKGILWPVRAVNGGKDSGLWKREVAVKTLIGLAVGLLSTYYPQTLFWGEGSLQCMVDGQRTSFAATKHVCQPCLPPRPASIHLFPLPGPARLCKLVLPN